MTAPTAKALFFIWQITVNLATPDGMQTFTAYTSSAVDAADGNKVYSLTDPNINEPGYCMGYVFGILHTDEHKAPKGWLMVLTDGDFTKVEKHTWTLVVHQMATKTTVTVSPYGYSRQAVDGIFVPVKTYRHLEAALAAPAEPEYSPFWDEVFAPK